MHLQAAAKMILSFLVASIAALLAPGKAATIGQLVQCQAAASVTPVVQVVLEAIAVQVEKAVMLDGKAAVPGHGKKAGLPVAKAVLLDAKAALIGEEFFL